MALSDREFWHKVATALHLQQQINRTSYVNETPTYMEFKAFAPLAGWQRMRVDKVAGEDGKHGVRSRAEKAHNSGMADFCRLDLNVEI